METLKEFTTKQLKNQQNAVMTTIHMMKNELSEDAINMMYAKVSLISEEIESREDVAVTTDSMYS